MAMGEYNIQRIDSIYSDVKILVYRRTECKLLEPFCYYALEINSEVIAEFIDAPIPHINGRTYSDDFQTIKSLAFNDLGREAFAELFENNVPRESCWDTTLPKRSRLNLEKGTSKSTRAYIKTLIEANIDKFDGDYQKFAGQLSLYPESMSNYLSLDLLAAQVSGELGHVPHYVAFEKLCKNVSTMREIYATYWFTIAAKKKFDSNR